MGTRGAFGLTIDGTDKIGYNQYDSYPEGKGLAYFKTLKAMIAEIGLDGVRAKAKALKVVRSKSAPTAAQIKALSSYANTGVSTGDLKEWYCLLRETHGELDLTLNCGYIEDAKNFLADSLFCEWAYVVNFDTGKFEVYEGFQEKKHDAGRFANLPTSDDSKYSPVKLIAEFDLANLPDDETFLAECNPPEVEATP